MFFSLRKKEDIITNVIVNLRTIFERKITFSNSCGEHHSRHVERLIRWRTGDEETAKVHPTTVDCGCRRNGRTERPTPSRTHTHSRRMRMNAERAPHFEHGTAGYRRAPPADRSSSIQPIFFGFGFPHSLSHTHRKHHNRRSPLSLQLFFRSLASAFRRRPASSSSSSFPHSIGGPFWISHWSVRCHQSPLQGSSQSHTLSLCHDNLTLLYFDKHNFSSLDFFW